MTTRNLGDSFEMIQDVLSSDSYNKNIYQDNIGKNDYDPLPVKRGFHKILGLLDV
jgi:hypothetical protein